jgi:FAD/FMN-containing dehydrogenase
VADAFPKAAVLSSALTDWRATLGTQYVVGEGPALDAANRACCGRTGAVAAVLYPADAEETLKSLAIGRTYGVPIHAVSMGLNWGYGSFQPPKGRAVVLCLRRLDGIGALDPKAARVRIEPGVTYGRFASRLQSDAPNLLAPEIGAGPDASVLGNALAGGIGKSPYGWMARRLSDIAVAFGDGRIERMPTLDKSGLGSSAADGVVLHADFHLCVAPKYHTLAWARLRDGGEAFASAFHLILSRGTADEPCEQCEFLNGARLRRQSRLWGGPSCQSPQAGWVLGLRIWGHDEAEVRTRADRAQRELASLPTLSTGLVGPERRVNAVSPDREGLVSAYASIGCDPPPDADPDRDGCGVRWIAAFLPTKTSAAVAALDALGVCALRNGFAPALVVRLPDGDPIGILGLFWNRRAPAAHVASADSRAARCAAECREIVDRFGLTPHRYRSG